MILFFSPHLRCQSQVTQVRGLWYTLSNSIASSFEKGGHNLGKQMVSLQESSALYGTLYAILPPSGERGIAIIIERDGTYKSLSPEEEASRQRQLEQAVHEKMMGLPKTSAFDWHATAKRVPAITG